jgi:S1-C subfamily serine protease
VNFLDFVVVLTAAGAAFLGYRLGFVRRLASWAGLAAGLALAIAVAPDVVDLLKASPPRTRLLVALGMVLVLAVGGQGIGLALGSALHRTLRVGRSPALRKGDQVAGGVLGAAGIVVLVWLLIPALASSPGWPAQAVRNSTVARAIDRLAPSPPSPAQDLGRLVGDESFPEVLDTLTTPDAGSPPEGGLPAAVSARVRQAVVKVEGVACDTVQEGTGFVAAPDLVVTNAHVIAGESRPRVDTPDGRVLGVQVAAFDPDRDLAVLRVPGLGMPALVRGDGRVDEQGSLFGHPGGGPLRESPMRIAEQIEARGTDITHSHSTTRDVFVLAAVTEPGDSGGPVVDDSGHVVGVVFAFDLTRATTAYALTGSELAAVLDPVLAGTAPAPRGTGPCLSD